jgi:hypothetical protein
MHNTDRRMSGPDTSAEAVEYAAGQLDDDHAYFAALLRALAAERDAAVRVCEALGAYKMAPGTTAWERMTQAYNIWRAARGGSDG